MFVDILNEGGMRWKVERTGKCWKIDLIDVEILRKSYGNL